MGRLYNVTCYKETGFDSFNIPEGPWILSSASTQTFPAVWVYQDGYRARIRLDADWDSVAAIDYCVIGPIYYWVTGWTMLTERTAELTLEMDALTTLGGFGQRQNRGINIQSGWTTRCMPTSDELFENMYPEPISPGQELVIDKGRLLGVDEADSNTYIGATIDLRQTEKYALDYEAFVSDTEDASQSGGTVTVPQTPELAPYETSFSFTIPGVGTYSKQLPNTAIYEYPYDPDNSEIDRAIADGIRAARSLGIDSAITCCYTIPVGWRGSASGQNGERRSIEGNSAQVSSQINVTWGSYTHRKVYALYNMYVVCSICSGDKKAFDAAEIVANTSGNPAPMFNVFADPSPTGSPYCQPAYYRGDNTIPLLNAVRGMPWQNTPFVFTTPSGSAISTAEYERKIGDIQLNTNLQLRRTDVQFANNMVSNTLRSLSNVVGGLAGMGASTTTLANTRQAVSDLGTYRQGTAGLEHYSEQRVVVPEIAFPRDESIQSYVGNRFYVYRVRLSDADSARFDQFFSLYGYATEKPTELSDFTSHTNFNYVQTRDVTLSPSNYEVNVSSRWIRERAQAQLNGGVRIWHNLPTIQTGGGVTSINEKALSNRVRPEFDKSKKGGD